MRYAIDYCKSLHDIWGDDVEQIEAHMESEGFSEAQIERAIDHVVGDLYE
jgi:hypothetical protein